MMFEKQNSFVFIYLVAVIHIFHMNIFLTQTFFALLCGKFKYFKYILSNNGNFHKTRIIDQTFNKIPYFARQLKTRNWLRY